MKLSESTASTGLNVAKPSDPSDRKNPGVVFWATVVLVVALEAYPLSFGPACWLVRHGHLTKLTAAHVYRPLIEHGRPPWLSQATIWYGGTADDGFPVSGHPGMALEFADLEFSGALRTSPPLNLDLRPR